MTFFQQLIDSFFSRNSDTLATADLLGYDETNKQYAQHALEVLITYKSKVHDFTENG